MDSRVNFKFSTKVKISILVAVSVVLMYFRVRVPIFPSFLDFDLSDIPIFFIGIMFSPILGVLAMGIKNILVFLIMGSFTSGVGEFANFLMGSCFVSAASFVFNRKNDIGKYILSFLSGMIALVVSGVLLNYFVILPVYAKVLGVSISGIIGEGTTIFKFLMITIVPYNIIKAIIIFVPTVFIFSKVKKINSRNNS